MTGRWSRWVVAGVALLVLAVLVLLVGAVLRTRDLQTAANVAQLVSIPLAAAPLVAGAVAWARRPGRAEQDSVPCSLPAGGPVSVAAASSFSGVPTAGLQADGDAAVQAGIVYPTTAPPAGSAEAEGSASRYGQRWWSVPPRRPGFVGRGELLSKLESTLDTEGQAVVAAVTGMGGIGKTTAAIEYAHRHAAELDLAWWVPSEDPALVPDRLAELARLLNVAAATDSAKLAVAQLHAELQRRDRWLVVFDNAENPRALEALIPQGPGRVLITSRDLGWRAHATTVELGEFTRNESVKLLQMRVPGLEVADARRVAEAVGDLPLALDQAAALLADTTLTVDHYLEQVGQRADSVFAHQFAGPYADSVAAVFTLAFDRLADDAPDALRLLTLLAWLGPEPVSPSLLAGHDYQLRDTNPAARPVSLQAMIADPLTVASYSDVLRRRALATVGADRIQIHRVVAALLRARTRDEVRAGCSWPVLAGRLLRSALPAEVWNNPPAWAAWAILLPHVLALIGTSRSLRPEPEDTSWLLDPSGVYLQSRGDLVNAQSLLEQAYGLRRERLTDDHCDTLESANNLARVLRALGQYERCRDLDVDTLDRRRRMLGDDHPDSLASASNLALDLRALNDYQEARQLGADTLARRRRVLGDDHADTLVSANNLAIDLSVLGENKEAYDLGRDTLARRRRTLGDDHPNTLASANNLALAVRALGDYARAWVLHEEVLTRRRRVLGDSHPATLSTIHSLGTDAYFLGDYRRARTYHEAALKRRRLILGEQHPDTLASAEGLSADLLALSENRNESTLGDATFCMPVAPLGDTSDEPIADEAGDKFRR